MSGELSIEGERPGLSRRAFIAASGLAITGVTSAGDDGSPGRNRIFSTCRPVQASEEFDLLDLSINDLRAGMTSGRWTAHDLVDRYLGRIAAMDRTGPTLRHVLDTNPDAYRIATDLDRERASGRVRGPLHGIPIVLKDNIDTGDQMTTTAGSLALEGSRALKDSFLAGRLRSAGAILLAKTSMSEWANFRSTRSSSGWCSRGGQGKNPYALDRTPCGSSSGSAGAVASSYAAAGIGTETDGSIVCPSATVGLVGIKPTVGLVSRSGIIPISASQDTAGPLARTVTDAAELLTALTGVDAGDSATLGSSLFVATDYCRFLDPDGLRGMRLGVTRKVFTGYHDGTDRLFEEALGAMRSLGAIFVDPADLPHAADSGDAENEVLHFEFKAGLNAYLAALGPDAPVKSLAEVIAFNERERVRVMPFFGQETMLRAEGMGPITSPAYRRAVATSRRLWRTEGIDQVMTKFRLDALVAPTGNPAWPIDLVNGDHFTGSVTTPAAVAGYPHITVPGGYVCGLPVGISFFGRAWSEPALIRMAYAFEQATRHRRTPEFLPSAATGPGTDGFPRGGD